MSEPLPSPEAFPPLAPVPTQYPPCDEDYAQMEATAKSKPFASTVLEPKVDANLISTDSIDLDENDDEPSDVLTGSEFGFNRPTHRKRAYDELLVIQRILFARIADDSTSCSDKAKLALAWEKLEDRKRILRGRPLPGNLRPESPRKVGGAPVSIVMLPESAAA